MVLTKGSMGERLGFEIYVVYVYIMEVYNEVSTVPEGRDIGFAEF